MDGSENWLVKPAPIDWSVLPNLSLPQRPKQRRLIADGYDRAHAESYDVLRTRLLTATEPRGWNRIGVTQARRGQSSPLTSINLALAEARRLNQRVVLLDLDIAQQPVLRLLGAPIPAVDRSLSVLGSRLCDQLVLATVPAPPTHGATVLLSSDFRTRLEAYLAQLGPDMVVVNLPPMLEGDAGLAALNLVQAVLLAVNGRADTAARLRETEARIGDIRPILGVFLHDAEA